MNRAQRRAQARQNKQQPRHGNVNLQTVVVQLNNSLRALNKMGIRTKDWDDPDATLRGFQIKHGAIHYVAVKENANDGKGISESGQTAEPTDQTEP